MNRRQTYTITMMVASLFVLIVLCEAILLDNKNAAASTSTSIANLQLGNQILPTATPQISDGEEVLMTNPALLQVMVILSIIAVLVIFGGVWINRHKLDMR